MPAAVRFTENFTTNPYWWDAAAPLPAMDDLPARVDVAIVGSGFCGLNAAITLARAGRSAAVLEADALGHGASTRSGGMVSSGQKLVVTGAIKGVAESRRERLLTESLTTFTYLKDLVADNALDADLQLWGRFFGAYVPAHYDRLRENGRLLREKTGVTVHDIPRARQREVIGSDYYYGGIVVDEYGGLHPAKYVHALAGLARRAGATLHSHAAVRGITRRDDGFLVRTARGELLANKVIVATNGYTGDLNPWMRRRVIPVTSYQIATEELPPGLMEKLNPGRRMISDSQRNLYYTRPSPDGRRMLFGSRPFLRDVSEQRAASVLYARMTEVWPELADYRVSHSWKGKVGMSFDKISHIGERDGIHYALTCNGNGVALMSFLGYRIAQAVLGTQGARSPFAEGEFPSAPYYFRKPWFVPAGTAWYELLDSVDARQRVA